MGPKVQMLSTNWTKPPLGPPRRLLSKLTSPLHAVRLNREPSHAEKPLVHGSRDGTSVVFSHYDHDSVVHEPLISSVDPVYHTYGRCSVLIHLSSVTPEDPIGHYPCSTGAV